ncbi:MAG: chemotaxis-specific protein-glutamate methyltransferase CheB [Solidesulfovibrio sp. DCME]|uniref:chemotaxis-specific protein-glutamate methyltransferase CheB n=1 Tax=Solidesulfovibrio sp. DCME TaxID=3447380 RepID=UPI003D0E6299
MKKIRVLIVDDSPLARALLRDFLEDEEDMEIVGEAADGREAVEQAAQLGPDLVTMDLEMPVMHGLEAIEAIMHSRAVPILVVSSVADAQNALAAVGRGALEAIAKPSYDPEEAAQFVAKVRMLAGVTVITRLRPRTPRPVPRADVPPVVTPPKPVWANGYDRVVAIASSTGGPQALAQILPALPADFPCPVVVAQHIADGFAAGMAGWLASICKLPVRLAADGEALAPGIVYISPSEKHLSVVPSRRFALLERAPGDIFHPCCDVLLSSVAEVFGRKAVGVILTGMSRDGAQGLSHIRDRGGVTLAQDEATSVIFGMNRVAIEAGAAQRVLPVDGIAEALTRLAGAGQAA